MKTPTGVTLTVLPHPLAVSPVDRDIHSRPLSPHRQVVFKAHHTCHCLLILGQKLSSRPAARQFSDTTGQRHLETQVDGETQGDGERYGERRTERRRHMEGDGGGRP